ncbi:uncharacterized protein TNCT_554781 [Trichonephila clavata]|uniref:Uncharacterized protein n=1 Tax=Trichonephila clavata TaxID=2740835 RepID=A0A8X6GBM1_TRICU|nr:uncharacterized protein TNCT_554781 [Trichonephila clavata]
MRCSRGHCPGSHQELPLPGERQQRGPTSYPPEPRGRSSSGSSLPPSVVYRGGSAQLRPGRYFALHVVTAHSAGTMPRRNPSDPSPAWPLHPSRRPNACVPEQRLCVPQLQGVQLVTHTIYGNGTPALVLSTWAFLLIHLFPHHQRHRTL